MKTNSPDSAGRTTTLPRMEWDFDNVPESELVSCCYREYARESAFIGDTAKRLRESGGVARPDAAGRKLRADVETVWGIGRFGWMLLGMEADLAQPWQSIPEAQRTQLLETILQRSRPFIWEWWPDTAKALLQSAETYSRGRPIRVRLIAPVWGTPVSEKRSQAGKRRVPKRNAPDDRPKPGVRYADNAETLMLTIAWGDYTNDQLAVRFRRWLKANRPKDIPQPDRRGEQFRHWRVALRRLGIMRLNYHCTRNRLRSWNPEAWERFGDYYKEWYEAPREAKKLFHRLFPFLDPAAEPIHLRPKRKNNPQRAES